LTPYDFAARHAHRAELRRYRPVEPMVVAYSQSVRRWRWACFTLMVVILVPLVISTGWAVATTENWRLW